MESRHLDAIEFNHDTGGMLLAASSLTGRHWTGGLYYFQKPEDAPDTKKSLADAQLEAGISDVKWISDSRLIAGSDSGTMMVWELQKENSYFHCVSNSSEHDGVIHAVSVNVNKGKALTAGQDRVIKVWDLESGESVHTYKGHCDSVLCASYHPSEQDVFISCSQGGNVVLWDLRKSKPAQVIDTMSSKSILPTCLEWLSNSQRIAIGTESGDVILQDIQNPKDFYVKNHVHKRAVHRLKALRSTSKQRNDWLATASEDCTATVLDLSQDSVRPIACVREHKDFVQGLSWGTSGELYTCAWDAQVLSTQVQQPLANGNEPIEAMSPD